MISRRQFLYSAALASAGVGLGLASYDLHVETYTADFILEQINVAIPGLPRAFDGYRIGFLTDIHLGVWVPGSWLERALAVLREQKIDLLLLGGDYILLHESSLWNTMGFIRNSNLVGMSKPAATATIYQLFAQLLAGFSCPDGVLAVVGNHEHWNMFPTFQNVMRDHPSVRVLINNEVAIRRGDQELVVFGVDDYLTGIPSAPTSRELRDGVRKRIILSHNPDYLSVILENPAHEFSLALCGHTHGGQIVLPGVGPIAAQVVDRRFVSGLHYPAQDRAVYTSRGLGVVGLPFRINCPAEITVCSLGRT